MRSYLHYRLVQLANGVHDVRLLSSLLQNECGIFLHSDGRDLDTPINDLVEEKLLIRGGPHPLATADAERRFMDRHGYPSPARVHWDITGNCNLTCPHCYKDSSPNVGYHFDRNLIESIVGQIMEVQPYQIEISGGEPMACSDLDSILENLSSCSTSVLKISTNGYGVTTARARELARFVRVANVSLDGLEAVHDTFRGREGSFRVAVDATRRFVEAGVAVTVACTLHGENYRQIDEIIRLAQQLHVQNLRFAMIQPVGRGSSMEQRWQIPPDRRRQIYDKLLEHRETGLEVCVECRDEMFGAQLMRFRDIYEQEGGYVHCGVGKRLIAINPNGYIVPCDFVDSPNHYLGHVSDTTLSEVWSEHDLILSMRELSGTDVHGCSGCDRLSVCGGGMLCNSANVFGDWKRRDPICCFGPDDNEEPSLVPLQGIGQ